MNTIALALGAGGARGLAHIHAIRAFDDLGIKPVVIAGTSIGSIIGAGASIGMSADEMTDHILSKISSPTTLMSDFFKVRPANLELFLKEGGPRIGELNLERTFEVFLPDALPDTFSDLNIPLKVVATDYYDEKAAVFQDGPLISALAASAAMPAVFLPVERDGRFYIDGSATNPCPLDILDGLADHIIAIDVSGGSTGNPKERPAKIDALYASSQMMQMSIVKNTAARHPLAVLLRPPVGSYRALDFLKAKAILQQTEPLQDLVKRQIERLLGLTG